MLDHFIGQVICYTIDTGEGAKWNMDLRDRHAGGLRPYVIKQIINDAMLKESK